VEVLNENRIVNAVVSFLEQNGCSITSSCTTTKRGFDIDAQTSKGRLIVEAKGEGAATPKKRDKFTRQQCRQSVEAGLYKLASHLDLGAELALALPETEDYLNAVRKIYIGLARLDISVFWVDRKMTVRMEHPLSNGSDNQKHSIGHAIL